MPEALILMMNILFEDVLNKGVIIFLNDVIIYSSILEEYYYFLD